MSHKNFKTNFHVKTKNIVPVKTMKMHFSAKTVKHFFPSKLHNVFPANTVKNIFPAKIVKTFVLVSFLAKTTKKNIFSRKSI